MIKNNPENTLMIQDINESSMLMEAEPNVSSSLHGLMAETAPYNGADSYLDNILISQGAEQSGFAVISG